MNKTLNLMALALFLAGCTATAPGGPINTAGDPTPKESTPPATTTEPSVLAKLGIAGAKSIFVAGSTSATPYRISSNGNAYGKLYRQNADSTITAVTAYDATGTATDSPVPNMVAPVTSDFVFLSLTDKGSYLVRKSDGKVAQLETKAVPDTLTTGTPIQADAAGNIYYAFDGVLTRVSKPNLGASAYRTSSLIGFSVQDTATADTLVKTTLTNPSLEKVSPNIAVDADGNVMAAILSANPNTYGPSVIANLRIYKAGGGVIPISGFNAGLGSWLGNDGKFYASIKGDAFDSKASRLDVNADGTVTVTALPATYDSLVSDQITTAYIGNRTVIMDKHLAPVTLVMGQNGQGAHLLHPAIYLHVIQDGAYIQTYLSNITNRMSMSVVGNKAFILGTNSSGKTLIDCYDFGAETESVVFSDPNYQIFSMAVGADGTMTVSALRYSDNTYIVGQITGGQLSVLSSTLPQVTSILPLQ